MKTLSIFKLADKVFDFYEGEMIDDVITPNGVKYSGNDIKISYFNDEIRIDVNGQKESFVYSNIDYDGGDGAVPFTSAEEVLTTLVADGFTGNFNTPQVGGGAKNGAYQFYHDGENYLINSVNGGLGYELSLSKTGTGTYEISGFTDNMSGGKGYVYSQEAIPIVSSGALIKNIDLSLNTEDGLLTIYTLDELIPSDSVQPSANLLFTIIL